MIIAGLARSIFMIIGATAVAVGIFSTAYYGAHVLIYVGKQDTGFASDSGWAQAIGAVLAIVFGFAGIIYQDQRQKTSTKEQEAAAGRAAHLIAFDALETVSERLEAALGAIPDETKHRLRGNRTNEMVAVMREFEISRIPSLMLADYMRLRSRIFAINERITALYLEEENRPEGPGREEAIRKRYKRLTSAVIVWGEAVDYFVKVEDCAILKFKSERRFLKKPESIVNYGRLQP